MKKLVPFVLGGVLVAVAVGYLVLTSSARGHTPQPPPAPVLFPVGTFTTNLADPWAEHYIRVSITLQVASAQVSQLLAQRRQQVENVILSVLRAQTTQQVAGAAGLRHLGQSLAGALNQALGGHDVLKVYFTQFLVE